MRPRTFLATLLLFGVPLASTGCGSAESADSQTAQVEPEESESGGDSVQQGSGPTATQTLKPTEPPGDPLHPVVAIETNRGEITVELDAAKAPLTVQNFLDYVNRGFYEQTTFHYVDPESMILGGGFTTDLHPKPVSAPIRNEAHNGLNNGAGTIAMSRQYDAIDSATSQFFINVRDNPELDHKDDTGPETYGYCVFGEVTDGMDVVQQISETSVTQEGEFINTPTERVVIESIRLIR